MLEVIIAVIVTLVLAIPVTYLLTVSYRQKVAEQKIGSAEEKPGKSSTKQLKQLRRRNGKLYWKSKKKPSKAKMT